jgi:ankyrin repeat protein
MVDYEIIIGKRVITSAIKEIIEGQSINLKKMLENGTNPDDSNDFGATLLMFASGEGKEDFVRLLLDNGANVNRKDVNGFTALMHACEENNHSIIKLLLERGADVEINDNEGNDVINQMFKKLYHLKPEENRNNITFSIHLLFNSIKNRYRNQFNIRNYIKDKLDKIGFQEDSIFLYLSKIDETILRNM